MNRQETSKRDKLGEILVRQGIVNRQQLTIGLEKQAATGDYLGEILIHLGYAESSEVYRILARQRGIPYIDLASVDIESEVLAMVPREFAEKYDLIPLSVEGATLQVAVSDHLDVMAFDSLTSLTGLQPALLLSSRREIRRAIRENYARPDEVEKDIERLLYQEAEAEAQHRETITAAAEHDYDETPNAPAVRMVDLMLQQAIDRKASDMHIEPRKDSVSLRYRIDGILHESTAPTRTMHDAIVSRIKILSNLDISEQRKPQDGRFSIQTFDIDVRVSIIPTIHGEKVQMRFLDKNRLVLDFDALGLNDRHCRLYENALRQSQGMILVTGPTGSGKTTTLYSGLAFVNTPEKHIMTVEDPVEYVFQSINQIQVHQGIGLTFDTVLRSILRQDPDVIMVGEIRDQETGEIAVRASLTGHLVLSTLHTVSTIAAVNRLISMGVQPYLLGSSLSLLIAQRLVRRICHRCKAPDTPPKEALDALDLDPAGTYYTGHGCRYCNGCGYRGQVAIFEMLPISRSIGHLIASNARERDIETKAIEESMITLARSAAEKVRLGITSAEEVLARITLAPGTIPAAGS